jgi:hypothetical protein
MGEMRNAWNILVGKHEGMRSLGRIKHRWEDEDVDWIQVAQLGSICGLM